MPSLDPAVHAPGPSADSLPFAFLRAELKLKFMVCPWPADLGRVFCACFPAFCQSLLLPIGSMQRKPATRYSVCVSKTQSQVYPWVCLRHFQVRFFQLLMEGLLDGILDTVNRIGIPLMQSVPSDAVLASSCPPVV